jgi:uncharacterized protein YdeI (YjbR/CyaY-like superfamily)
MDPHDPIAAFIARHPERADALHLLDRLLREEGLTPTIKWGQPTYTLGGSNVAGLGVFKSYFGLWFFQGALLSDPEGLLVAGSEGRTQAQRQLRFRDGEALDADRLRTYIAEAVSLAREGKRVAKPAPKAIILPDELSRALDADTALAQAFGALSAACRREYAGYVAEAKKEETRLRRVEKVIPMILSRAGLHDQHRK